MVRSSFCYENVQVLLLLLSKFACAVCTHNFPILPSNVPSLNCLEGYIGSTFAFRITHLPASEVEEKAVLAYIQVLFEVVVGLMLPPGSQLQCCIVNMPVPERKSVKMSAYKPFASVGVMTVCIT